MHIEVYDENLAPSKALDRQVTHACKFFDVRHLETSLPTRVVLHNCDIPGSGAKYHGLYPIDGRSTHLVSIYQPPPFSFPDSAHSLVHEFTHAIQAEVEGLKPKQHDPLRGYSVNSFVSHEYREEGRLRGPLTLADVVAEGVATFVDTEYIKGLHGTIFNRLFIQRDLANQHASVVAAMKTIYPAQYVPLETDRDNINESAIGYRMMRRFGKVWSRADKNMGRDDYLLSEMVGLDLRKCQHVPVLAHRGGLNPEFLHYYHHPEELPLAPLRTQPFASA